MAMVPLLLFWPPLKIPTVALPAAAKVCLAVISAVAEATTSDENVILSDKATLTEVLPPAIMPTVALEAAPGACLGVPIEVIFVNVPEANEYLSVVFITVPE